MISPFFVFIFLFPYVVLYLSIVFVVCVLGLFFVVFCASAYGWVLVCEFFHCLLKGFVG